MDQNFTLKKKGIKEPKPQNPYVYWTSLNRATYKETYPEMGPKEIMKLLEEYGGELYS